MPSHRPCWEGVSGDVIAFTTPSQCMCPHGRAIDDDSCPESSCVRMHLSPGMRFWDGRWAAWGLALKNL